MALSGASAPDRPDPTSDAAVRETLRLWEYLGHPLVKDFGLGMIAWELAGGLSGSREEMTRVFDLLCFLYDHLLREAETQSKASRKG